MPLAYNTLFQERRFTPSLLLRNHLQSSAYIAAPRHTNSFLGLANLGLEEEMRGPRAFSSPNEWRRFFCGKTRSELEFPLSNSRQISVTA
jgi:hypothetical protein